MIKKIVICILLSLSLTHCSAETSPQNEKLSQVKSDIDAVKKKMQQLMLQKNTLADQLAEIENQYGETAAFLRTLKKQVEQKRESLNDIARKIRANREQIEQHGKELSGQIKTAYAIGHQEKLKLLFNQQDPALSSRMMVYYGYFNKIRLKKMTEIEESVKRLNQLNQQQHKETEFLQRDLEQKKLEQAALDNLRSQRNELLEQLSNDFSSNEQQLSRLQESEAKLKNLIDTLQDHEENSFASVTGQAQDALETKDHATESSVQSSVTSEPSTEESFRERVDFSTLRGKLPWPVKGKPVTGNTQIESLRDGVLINAGEGTEIHAVTTGKVVFSEWLRGYGLLMIIDHGNGYMTLYAFNQSLYKRAGDWVRAGDVIASVGQSGGRSRSALYFGIRKNGKPVDPLEWCPKPGLDQTG
jgi:septal ring factor EnvC (AmiA/AmiB activator)